MTETFGIYAWGRDLATPEYPIAAPLDELQPGFELRLADDDGNEVADGVRAQILLRGPTTLFRWKRQALIDAGVIEGTPSVEADELAAAHKRIAPPSERQRPPVVLQQRSC